MTDLDHAPGVLLDGPSNCIPFPSPGSEPLNTGQLLSLRHARQLANAEAYAASQGWPLTAHVTIHFRLAEGFSPEGWAAFQTTLLDKAARWLKRHGIPVAFAWVRECGSVKGPHLHLLVHLPHAMWGRFKAFLLYAGGFTVSDAGGEAIRISGGRFGMYANTMRAGVSRYALKSLPPATCESLGIRHSPTLPVELKRCGVSHSISQKARQASVWQELRTLQELHGHLNPANDNQAGEVCDAA